MHNIKLTLQYDGTAYHGWQTQENAITVQATVENVIKKLTGTKPQLVGCGRTDTGVHAKKRRTTIWLGYYMKVFQMILSHR